MVKLTIRMRRLLKEHNLYIVPSYIKRLGCCHCGYRSKFLFTDIKPRTYTTVLEVRLWRIEIGHRSWCMDCVERLFNRKCYITVEAQHRELKEVGHGIQNYQ